jgi:GH18 family chitinase
VTELIVCLLRYQRFTNLKQKNPKLVLLLAVGGNRNFQIGQMTAMLAAAVNRTNFIQTSITYLRQRNFDGIDLDFQYPGSGVSPADDKKRYTSLIQVRNALIKPHSIYICLQLKVMVPLRDCLYIQ